MRIDKYLKNSRIIKRRTVAQDACQGGKVKINGRTAKPGAKVEIGDIIEISFGSNIMKIRVEKTDGNQSKGEAESMYTAL